MSYIEIGAIIAAALGALKIYFLGRDHVKRKQELDGLKTVVNEQQKATEVLRSAIERGAEFDKLKDKVNNHEMSVDDVNDVFDELVSVRKKRKKRKPNPK